MRTALAILDKVWAITESDDHKGRDAAEPLMAEPIASQM